MTLTLITSTNDKVNISSHFANKLKENNLSLKRNGVSTVQVNIGKRCNQACHHCHVEAGPDRTENMTRETIDQLLLLIEKSPQISTVDITGGAPELNPNFRHFVTQLHYLNKQIIVRCNLTVLFEENQHDTPEFFASHHVDVVSSLPCYLQDNVDSQRGKGVFDKSIKALQKLNSLGYGREENNLTLNLVYNPTGIHLPPAQQGLEKDYKRQLLNDFGITFNRLFTITNMPIKRFAHQLKREGKLEEYMQLLVDNFNPQAVDGVMCKNMISIGWDGKIYDCDFNQMLELPLKTKQTLWDISSFDEITPDIMLADHCYGCTAGSGSSCGGSLV